MITIDQPKVYVACLAAYNNGFLHGKWIDVSGDEEDLQDAINNMLKDSPEPDAEEWAIHDFEGFGDYRIEEYTRISELCEIANLINNDENDELILSLMDHLGSGTSIDDAKEFLENNYRGKYKDLGDYAYEQCEQSGDLHNIPPYIQYHIDFDAMGRDWDYSGDIFTISEGHEIHVFSNH